ncbi:MAG TPA: hypothetical protein PKY15_07625, partial [Methanoregulaceae archaeon]|nr:hypothetical protein [Methanoregulaceae archaeon]
TQRSNYRPWLNGERRRGLISVYPIFSILLLFYTQNEIKPGNKKRSKYAILVILTMITGYFPHAEGSRLRIHKPHNAIY